VSEIAFERLLDREVRDADGRKIGRIHEAVAERRGGEWVVTEFHLGTGALLESLAGFLGRRMKVIRVPWDRLDLDDPERPRIRPDGASSKRT
jgi:sporulation protein YlmC with PRC-barrel domain